MTREYLYHCSWIASDRDGETTIGDGLVTRLEPLRTDVQLAAVRRDLARSVASRQPDRGFVADRLTIRSLTYLGTVESAEHPEAADHAH